MAGRVRDREVKHLVVDADHLTAARLQMPAHLDVVGRRGGREVERPGRIGPPVHQQLLVIVGVAVNSEPAYITQLAASEFEAAEAQALLGGIKLRDLPGVEHHERLALRPGLMRSASLAQYVGEPP